MKEFALNKHNKEEFYSHIDIELKENGALIVSTQKPGVGKWGMARLWRAWMKTTAEYMSSNGVTMPLMFDKNGKPWGKREFNATDAHELFTRQHGGVDAYGLRLSWSKDTGEEIRKATKGERFNMLRKHEIWCSDKGISLYTPRDSEYNKLINEE